MRVLDFLSEFISALQKQLEEDETRWGDTWLKRSPEGQVERTKMVFDNYFDQFTNAGIPVPWLKIAGGAMICWIRDQHPEYWNNKEKTHE